MYTEGIPGSMKFICYHEAGNSTYRVSTTLLQGMVLLVVSFDGELHSIVRCGARTSVSKLSPKYWVSQLEDTGISIVHGPAGAHLIPKLDIYHHCEGMRACHW